MPGVIFLDESAGRIRKRIRHDQREDYHDFGEKTGRPFFRMTAGKRITGSAVSLEIGGRQSISANIFDEADGVARSKQPARLVLVKQAVDRQGSELTAWQALVTFERQPGVDVLKIFT